jgi:hypothetical protein
MTISDGSPIAIGAESTIDILKTRLEVSAPTLHFDTEDRAKRTAARDM